MTDVMTHLPRYVPAQIAAARAAAERRARMTPTRPRLVTSVPSEAPPALLNLRPGERLTALKVHEVQRAVCGYLGARLEDMVGKSLHAVDVRPRQLAMYLACELTGKTVVDIGRRFGGRDQTSVIHACKKITSAVKNDPLYARAVREIREMLK